jgi:site-specific recombinase XerD
MTRMKGTPPPNAGRTFPAEVLTEDEVRALLRQCSLRAPTGIRNRALITIMYRGGLRISEALDLRPADVDLAAGEVRVLHGKGDKARTVGLDDGAIAIVQRWADARRSLGIRNGWLICTLAGKRVSDVYVRNMLRRIGGKAGLEKRIHPHGLRHTCAAELARAGVPMNVIQKQLGHVHLSTTSAYLDHIGAAEVIAMGRNREPFSET